MSFLTFEYDESGNSVISAFAYNTGHLIEELIKKETGNLKEDYTLLQAKVLSFYHQLPDSLKTKYAEYFELTIITKGLV